MASYRNTTKRITDSVAIYLTHNVQDTTTAVVQGEQLGLQHIGGVFILAAVFFLAALAAALAAVAANKKKNKCGSPTEEEREPVSGAALHMAMDEGVPDSARGRAGSCTGQQQQSPQPARGPSISL